MRPRLQQNPRKTMDRERKITRGASTKLRVCNSEISSSILVRSARLCTQWSMSIKLTGEWTGSCWASQRSSDWTPCGATTFCSLSFLFVFILWLRFRFCDWSYKWVRDRSRECISHRNMQQARKKEKEFNNPQFSRLLSFPFIPREILLASAFHVFVPNRRYITRKYICGSTLDIHTLSDRKEYIRIHVASITFASPQSFPSLYFAPLSSQLNLHVSR